MTVISMEFNVTQVSRLKSTDTVSEICMNLCGNILKYLSDKLRGNPAVSDRIDTVNTMLAWYVGIFCRACMDDVHYRGLPRITMVYIEKSEMSKSSTIRHAFGLDELDKIPVPLLMELIHKVVRVTLECIRSDVVTMTSAKTDQWAEKIFDLLSDLAEILEIEPNFPRSGLSSVMVRVHLPDGKHILKDYV